MQHFVIDSLVILQAPTVTHVDSTFNLVMMLLEWNMNLSFSVLIEIDVRVGHQQTVLSISLHKPKEPANGHFYEKPCSLSRVNWTSWPFLTAIFVCKREF